MEILIKSTPEEASRHGAKVIAHLIREKPDAVLGLATGRTPVMLYKELIRLHKEDGLDFSEVTTFNLGGIDLQVLGLGSNGHIGFNEPTGSLNSRTWVKILSQQTVKDNSDLFDNPEEVPRHCLTMGVGTILDAKRCLVLAFGHKKAKAVVNLVEGPVTAMCPASALQMHPRTTVLIDENAAARLDNAEHYHWINQHKLDWQKYD